MVVVVLVFKDVLRWMCGYAQESVRRLEEKHTLYHELKSE